jgi:hypothetical protein
VHDNDDRPHELYTLAEVAQLAKVNLSTIWRHHDRGLIEFVYLAPRLPRVTRADLDRYLAGSDGVER